MTISEQVAELEKQVQNSGREASKRREVEQYLIGVRAGVRDESAATTTTEVIECGRAEGAKLRMEITEARDADLRRALMRALHYDDSVALLSWEEVLREVMQAQDAAMKARAEEIAAVKPTPDGHYLIRNVPGYTRPVHAKVAGGNVWGYSVYAGVAGYRTLGRAIVGWTTSEMKWEEERALPVGPVRPGQPCPICHRQMFVHPDSELFLDGDGPHTCDEGAKKAAPTVHTGGNPPAPEIGMVYTNGTWAIMVTVLPHSWLSDTTEVRAPWGGAVVWRRA